MICRVKFGENAAGKFLSHLDMLRAWQRAISRSGLPLSYSNGFNKHPKLAFSAALSVGFTSVAEYADIEFDEELALDNIFARLKTNLPPALEIYDIKELSKNDAAIMSIVERAAYRAILQADDISEQTAQEAVKSILSQETLEVSRRKKNSRDTKMIDIRPWIYTLEAVKDDDYIVLDFIVQNSNDGNVKPQEVIDLFIAILGGAVLNIERREMYAQKNGQFVAVMEV